MAFLLRGFVCSYVCSLWSAHIQCLNVQMEAASYTEIELSLGVDTGKEVIFATDIYAEAVAAKAAGWESVLVMRPGNKPLPVQASAEFPIIESLEDLLAAV